MAHRAELPPDPPFDLLKCDPEPAFPDPATLPPDDARPYVEPLVAGVHAGRDCRLTVAAWVAWWRCEKAAAADPRAPACDAAAELLKALRASRPAPTAPVPTSSSRSAPAV